MPTRRGLELGAFDYITEPFNPAIVKARLRNHLELLKKHRDRLTEETRPCKEILGSLLQRRWPEGQEAVLVELNRLVQHYRLTEALTILDIEFKGIMENGDGAEGLP